jgi:hypothetical protein
MRIRQRLEQYRVNYTKYGSRSSNSQRDREHYDGGKSGRFAKHSRGVADVLNQHVDKISRERFAAFFFEPLLAAEFDARPTFSLEVIESGTFQIGHALLEVRAELFLHLTLGLRTAKKFRV